MYVPRNRGKVVQHLPTKSPLAPNLTSTTHRPSHSSAAKFLTSRLYSKKRMISVLDAGTANHAPISERKKETGKMSAMSKYLLGLGPDPEIKVAGNKSEKKRSLLLQAQGVRKSGQSIRVPFLSLGCSSELTLRHNRCSYSIDNITVGESSSRS